MKSGAPASDFGRRTSMAVFCSNALGIMLPICIVAMTQD